jgi:hypothetical protein
MLAVVCGLRLPLPRVVKAAVAVVVVGDEEEGSKREASRARGPLTVGDGGAEGRRVATAGFIEAVGLSSMVSTMAGRGCGGGEGEGSDGRRQVHVGVMAAVGRWWPCQSTR